MGYTIGDLIHEDAIVLDLAASSREEVFQKIEEIGYEKGYVKKGFGEAILEREKLYPTALPTDILKVAIPHPIEQDTVISPTIIIARLAQPVEFVMMGTLDEPCDVDIVFALAVKGSEDQLQCLQDLISLFQDPEVMEQMKAASTAAEISEIIYKAIGA